MYILGLDIGEKRIGAAITDRTAKIAVPLAVIENNPGVKEKLNEIIIKKKISKIIVGNPVNLSGKEGPQAENIRQFVKKNLSDFKIPVIFIDERFTSKISKSLLSGRNIGKQAFMKRKKHDIEKGELDKLSAVLILDDYIKRARNKPED